MSYPDCNFSIFRLSRVLHFGFCLFVCFLLIAGKPISPYMTKASRIRSTVFNALYLQNEHDDLVARFFPFFFFFFFFFLISPCGQRSNCSKVLKKSEREKILGANDIEYRTVKSIETVNL